MAAIEVTISGVLYDKLSRTTRPCVLIGEASITGLEVGGGPMPGGPGGGEPPLGIWGPPTMPPGYWGGGMGPGVKPQPHPEHPIVLPPDLPPEIPPPNGGGSPIPIDWKTGWTEETGWIVVGVPTVPHPTPSK